MINFGFKDGVGSRRFVIKMVRYKPKDMVRREFNLCFSYRIVKWRSELKQYATFWGFVKDLFAIGISKNFRWCVKLSKWEF